MAPKNHSSKVLKDYGWSVYLDGLLLCAVFLCLENILSFGRPSFWALGFLYGAHFYWRDCRDCLSVVSDRMALNFLFLAGPLAIMALSFETASFSYLALIPTMVLMGMKVSASERLRSYLLIFSLVGVMTVLALSKEALALTSIDVFLVLALFVMNFGPMSVWHYQDDKSSEEKLFLHDLTGEIHGMGLYIDAHETLERKEMKSMVKALAELVRAHSEGQHGMNHRSLDKNSKNANYSECISELRLMIKSYLTSKSYTVEILHEGLLENVSAWHHFYLPRDQFRRLLLNIVKNIAEAGSDRIEFKFTGLSSGLGFQVKNNLKGLTGLDDGQDLETKLGSVIQKSETNRGMGLISMAQICERSGGHFHFSFEGHCWQTSGELCWVSAHHEADTSGKLAA